MTERVTTGKTQNPATVGLREVPGQAVPAGSHRGYSHVRGHSVETELVALDVLHHEARLVAAIGRQ